MPRTWCRFLSVSTVIQKFLDTSHTDLLRQYLEAVSAHAAVMKPAYAAVLISLYVQLRDRAGLQRFLNDSIDEGSGGYRYDVSEAVDSCLYGAARSSRTLSFSALMAAQPAPLCAAEGVMLSSDYALRAGGYHEEARLVAQASGLHAKTVDICLNHIAGPAGGDAALQYIAALPPAEQELLLQRHGKVLVRKYGLEMSVRFTAATSVSLPRMSAAVPVLDQAGILSVCLVTSARVAFLRTSASTCR